MGKRTLVNLVAFLAISGFLLFFGATRFLFPPDGGRTLTMNVADASGLLPRSDVTVRGIPAGSVTSVEMAGDGTAMVGISLDPGVFIPEGTKAEVTRRSPIGDLTINLLPGDGPPLPDGGSIPMEDTTLPPDPEDTIDALATFLNSVPPESLDTLITEAAIALRGRGSDLASLSESGADLPERILEVRTQLESLIRTGPEVLEVLAANAPTLGDDITQTRILAEILRDRRYDLVDLTRNGARFAEVFGDLLASQKPNIACALGDFGLINETIGSGENLANLQAVLELNHFFFEGVDQTVQKSTSDDLDWFRVHFLPPQQPAANGYEPPRAPPDVFAADACHSRYGPGVGPGTQPGNPYLVPGSKLHPGQP